MLIVAFFTKNALILSLMTYFPVKSSKFSGTFGTPCTSIAVSDEVCQEILCTYGLKQVQLVGKPRIMGSKEVEQNKVLLEVYRERLK